MKVFCPNCGNEIKQNARFCENCGQSVIVTTVNKSEETSKQVNIFTNQVSSENRRRQKRGVVLTCVLVLVLCIIVKSCTGVDNGAVNNVENLLQEDLGTSVRITELYYHENNQAYLVEFKTEKGADIAAVYLNSGEILYDSDFEYYQSKFNNASGTSERGKWASKVLEYADLADWEFSILVNGATQKNGWKQIK